MWGIPWSRLQCWHFLACDSLQCFSGYRSFLRCSEEHGFIWNCTWKWSAFQSASTEPGKQNKDKVLIAFPAFRKMFLSGTQACHSIASGESQILNNLSFPLNREELFNLHSVIFLFLSTSGCYSSTYNNFFPIDRSGQQAQCCFSCGFCYWTLISPQQTPEALSAIKERNWKSKEWFLKYVTAVQTILKSGCGTFFFLL